MTHIAEKFASNVAGCSPRSTNLALMLWLWRKKAKVSNQTGSFGNSRALFLSWNDCWPPTYCDSLHLVCKMRAGRRGRGWALACSGRSCCLRKMPGAANQKQRAWGRKTHQAGCEKTFLSPELFFSVILPKPQLVGVLHRGTALSRC